MSFRRSANWMPGAVAMFVAIGLSLQSVDAADVDTDEPVEAPVPAKRYLLRYKFQPNDLVYYDVQQRSTQTVKGNGILDVTTTDSSERKHFRVISVDKEGTGLLELVIDHVKMKVKFGTSDPIEFDSQSSGPTPRQFRHIRDLIGRPRARTHITTNGELKKVVLLNRPPRAATRGGQMLAAPDTDDTDPSHNFLVMFPKESIAVGHTWSDRITVRVRATRTLTRPITLLRRYELKSVKGNRATIAMETRILTAIRDAKILTQLIQRTPTTTAVFDIDRGLIVSRTMEINQRQVGGITEKSSMHVVTRRTEKLVTPQTNDARVSRSANKSAKPRPAAAN